MPSGVLKARDAGVHDDTGPSRDGDDRNPFHNSAVVFDRSRLLLAGTVAAIVRATIDFSTYNAVAVPAAFLGTSCRGCSFSRD
jgi:hypothetical protein